MSSLCDYSDAFIIVKGTKTVENIAAHNQTNNIANKKVIVANCAPFTNCISRINNTANATARSFNLKAKTTGQTGNNGTKNVEIMVTVK